MSECGATVSVSGAPPAEPESSVCARRGGESRYEDASVRVHLGVYRGGRLRRVTALRAASHCSAVLDAGLGGDVGPGEQGAEEGLRLAVQPLRDGAGAQAGQGGADVLDIVEYCPWRMSSIDVEHVCESVLEDAPYGVVVGQVVVLPEVPVLIEVDGSVVGGEDVQVDRFTVVLSRGGDVLLQTVQQ